MSILYINTGTNPNAGDGDSIRLAFTKINANFGELYGNLQTSIPLPAGNTGKFLSSNGTDIVWSDLPEFTTNELVNGSYSLVLDSNGNVNLATGTNIYIGGTPISLNITVSDSAPSDPTTGSLWYDEISGRMYVWYDTNWVDASPRGPAGTQLPNENGHAGEFLTTDGSNLSWAAVSSVVGAQGPQGPSGAAGSNGATGPQGPSGAAGSNGATGPQGPQGVVGPTGPSRTDQDLFTTSSVTFSNLTVTNTASFIDVDISGLLTLGQYQGYDNLAIIKNDPDILNFTLRNLHVDSATEINIVDNYSGGLTIVHQNSTAPSGDFAAGENFIYGESINDTINIGRNQDLKFFADENWVNWSSATPVLVMRKSDGSIIVNNNIYAENIIPQSDNSYDLGVSTSTWRNLWVNYINGTAVSDIVTPTANGTFSTLPDFLDFIGGTSLSTGQTSEGVFFSGNAGNENVSYPVRTNFPIDGTVKVVVTLDMVVNSGCSDFSVCVLDGSEGGIQPQWAWDSNPTRIAASYNCTTPHIYGLTSEISSGYDLPGDDTYRVRFTYDPNNSPNVTLETLDTSNTVLDTISLDGTLDTTKPYFIGFAADQDDTALRTYIKNLIIEVDGGATYTDSLQLSGVGGSGYQLTSSTAVVTLSENGVLTIPGNIESTTGTGDVVINATTGTNTGTWTFGSDGNLTAPGNLAVNGGKIILHPYGNSYIESVGYGIYNPTSSLNIFAGPDQKITLRSGFGTEQFWAFDTTGKLTFPNESTFNGVDFVAKENEELNLTILDSSAYIGVKENNTNINEPAAYMDVYYGKKSRIRTTSLDNQTEYNWYFNPNGSLTLPNNTTIGDATSQTVIPATRVLVETFNQSGFAWNVSHYPAVAVPGLEFITTDWFVSGPGIDGTQQLTRAVHDTNAGVVIVEVGTWNGSSYTAGTFSADPAAVYTFYSPVTSIGTKLTVNSNDWTFGTDGVLTVPGDIESTTGIGDVVINATTGTNTGTWTFDTDGVLTVPGSIIPDSDKLYDLGSTSSQWRSLYVSTNTIYIGGVPLSLDSSTSLTINGNPVVTYNSTSGNFSAGGASVQGSGVYESNIPPDNTNLLWYDTVSGRLYIYYDSSWVDASPGAIGPSGPQGPSGPSGANGAQGPSGAAGANGARGPQGPSGVNGPQGPSGAAGSNGAQGPQGPSGAAGSNGAQGPQGPSGAAGSNGAQGPQGPSGAAGSNGAQGPQGPSGVAGPTGPMGLFTATGNIIGTLTNVTLVAGSYSYTFDNTGTFTMPAGSILNASNTVMVGGYSQIGGLYSSLGVKYVGSGTQYGIALQSAGDNTTAVTFINAAGTGIGSITQTSSAVTWNGNVANGYNVNTKASALVNAGVDVTLGNLKARIPTSGNRSLQISTVSGTYSVFGAEVYNAGSGISGAYIDGASPFGVTTTPAYLRATNNFTAAGFIDTWNIMDPSAGLAWRITCIIGVSYNNNMICIERLI